MVVEIDNPANKHMHYGDGVIVKNLEVPDKLPKRILYSNSDANQKFEQIQADIYNGQKHAKPIENVKTPTIIKILLGVTGAAAILLGGKKILKTIKNIFTK